MKRISRHTLSELICAAVFGSMFAAAVFVPDAWAEGAPGPAVRAALEQVRQRQDNAGRPFIVIDKRDAHLWLFDSQGRAVADSPVLLGQARGDDTVPGIGDRPLAEVLPHERTTPAGRFTAELGRNGEGEDVIWVDYEAAVSLHRVRARVAAEQRLQRLASPTPDDNRVSWGCINVPVAFFERHLLPLVAGRAPAERPLVYVLPETRPLNSLFSSLRP
jgi:hypothetical protein